MPDLVGTCPKSFWEEWLAEGDCAGDEDSGEEYEWHTRAAIAGKVQPGDRFYIAALGKLRGYATVRRVEKRGRAWVIVRGGNAVAVTVPGMEIPGFRGLRTRWWHRNDEVGFADWKQP